MKYFLQLVFFLIVCSCSEKETKQNAHPVEIRETNKIDSVYYIQNSKIDSFWIKRNYKYAKLYLYNGTNYRDSIILKNKLHKSVITKKGLLLSDSAVADINAHILKGKLSTDTIGQADCFMPHHGIVFYNQKHKPVGHISICFVCGGMYLFPSGNEFSLDTLEKIFKQNQIPVYHNENEVYKYLEYKN